MRSVAYIVAVNGEPVKVPGLVNHHADLAGAIQYYDTIVKHKGYRYSILQRSIKEYDIEQARLLAKSRKRKR